MFADPQKNLTQFGVGPGMKVADLGAGSGFYSLEAAKLVTGAGKVFAVEVQKDLLDRLKNMALSQRLTNIEVVWGDVEKIGGTKLREFSCDRVVASNLLFQLEDKNNFCLEIKRILKPGGKVLVVDWSTGLPMGPATYVDKPSAEALFTRAGFTKESEIDAGDNHYGLIFKK